jgi:hypothetical protein
MKITLLSIPLFLFAFVACNFSEPSHFVGGDSASSDKAKAVTSESEEETTQAYAMVEQMPEFKANQVSNPTVDEAEKIPSQIIKNADVRFQVEELSKSMQAVQRMVKEAGGYISSSNTTRNNRESSEAMSIRVPYPQFEKLLDELIKQSVFTNNKTITSEDVTEQFIDIQARLKNKKQAEQRYLEILRQAKTVKEILEVETQLRQIREETEAQEGRLKYLKDRVKYSTIALEMYQPIGYQAEPEISFFSKIASSISKGWFTLLDFTVAMVSLWPFWIMLAALFYIVQRWRRSHQAKVVSQS